MKVYFAADHAGFDLKNVLLNFVRGELGHDVEDCGAFEKDANDDYPEIVAGACRSIVRDLTEGIECRGIILGASGQGEAMAANRFNAVRAAVYYGSTGSQTDGGGMSLDMLASIRGHNDSNVLSLGARFLSENDAKNAVKTWLAAPFTGDERHVRRIGKLDTLQGQSGL
ncbi:MAG: RpiB/LacA/LacB family sugar-phosphate isomerase [Candidatus Pacebacteria bacterium]|nr:RpiB/LacA/LacB family sugar-phosphate isomerase [Candidatus Paceibacterota bacterium]